MAKSKAAKAKPKAKSSKPAAKKPAVKAKVQASKAKLATNLKAKLATNLKAKLATNLKAKPAKKAAVKPAKATPKAAAKPALTKAAGGLKRFNPLDDRIVIERLVQSEKTAGGLYIPDSAQEKPTTGRVVAVGRGHRDAKGRIRPCDVKIGDTVLFTAWSGSEIEVDGTKYVVMREPDLLGVTTV